MCTCKGVCTCKTTMQELMRGLRYGIGSYKLSDTTNEGEKMTETLIKTDDRVRIEHFMGTREGTYTGSKTIREGVKSIVSVCLDSNDYHTMPARLYLIKSAEEIAAERAEQEKRVTISEVRNLIRRFGDSRFNEGAWWARRDRANEAEATASVRALQEQINKKLEELL